MGTNCKTIRLPFIFLLGLLGLCCLHYLYLYAANCNTLKSSIIFTMTAREFNSNQKKTNWSRRSLFQEDEHFSDTRSINLYSEGDFTEAYYNHHVGFPDLEHVDCPTALSTETNNSMYRQTVERKWEPEILNDTQICSFFVNKYGFNRYPKPSAEEEDFPIAFIILFHRDLDQMLFYLRAIYRPHNAYCLSIDLKSSARLHSATRAVARCLPNVFVSSKLEDVVYAGMSRLMADINCFRDLIKHPVKWRYIINSPGQQFPLKTNLEMVQVLKLFNGTNDILGQTGKKVLINRFQYVFRVKVSRTTGETTMMMTNQKHVPPPFDMPKIKCSAYGSFSRSFVQFVLTNKLAKDLLEWSQYIYSPDESYWGMLNYNHIHPAPGGYLGEPDKNPWLSSFSQWQHNKSAKCRSKFTRSICIFSPADLPHLATVPNLFANKLKITRHPAALHCLDQRIFNNTVSGLTIDTKTYMDILQNRFKAHVSNTGKKDK